MCVCVCVCVCVGRVAQSYSNWLGAGRSRIEFRWGRDFPSVQTGPGTHPASCKMGTGSFPGVKCGRGVMLTTHPLLVPRSWKSRAIPLPTLWATPGLWRGQFTFIYIYIYIYICVCVCVCVFDQQHDRDELATKYHVHYLLCPGKQF